MTLVILASLLAFFIVPGGQARPAAIRPRSPAEDCISRCRANWGWPGHPFSPDRWGPVVDPKLSAAPANDSVADEGAVEAAPSSAAVSTTTSGTSTAWPHSVPTTSSTSTSSSSKPSHISTQGFKVSAPNYSSSSGASEPSSSAPEPSSPPSPTHPPPTPPPFPPPPSHSSSPSPAHSDAPAPSPAPSANSGSGPTSPDDIQAYLAGHNDARAQHGAAPLTYSQDLAAKAQQWADGCQFKHSGGSLGPFGENLAAGTGDAYDIPAAIKQWTDEAANYDSSNPQPSHFTQVVWKATTRVGCALRMCDGIFPSSDELAKYYVCEYSPQGNVLGNFAANVQA